MFIFYTAAEIIYLFSLKKYVRDAFSNSEKYKLVSHPPSHECKIVSDFRVLTEIRIEKAIIFVPLSLKINLEKKNFSC